MVLRNRLFAEQRAFGEGWAVNCMSAFGQRAGEADVGLLPLR